jgi:PAS domain S-box-containing protein
LELESPSKLLRASAAGQADCQASFCFTWQNSLGEICCRLIAAPRLNVNDVPMLTPIVSPTASEGLAPRWGKGETRDDRLRFLLETLPVAVLNCDREGLIEYFNPQAAALWGRTPALRDARERYCGSIRILRVSGEVVPHPEGPMAEALRTGTAQANQECIVERPDGTRIVILVNVTPHLGADGQITGAVSCMLDITERKRMEEMLRAHEQEFRTIVENTPDLIVRYNRELRRTFVNRATAALFDLPPEALLGGFAGTPTERTARAVPISQIDQLQNSIRHVFESGEPAEFTLKWLRVGSQRDYNFYLAPERDSNGAVVSVLALGRDVSELKASEEALRRAQAYLAEGQRLTHTGSWAWDATTRENIYWSEETYRIYGLTPRVATKGLLARADYREVLGRIHPDDRGAFERPIDSAIEAREDYERHYRILLPDGSVKYIHSIGHPVADDSGRVVEVVGTAMDVTERKLSDALLAAEKRTMEMIARNDPLGSVLDGLCAAIDEQSAGLISTIMLMDADGQKLWPTAGPHAPPTWTAYITPLPVGPDMGSCGSAAYHRQSVIVTDIASDPRWGNLRDVALAHGLRACWSTPIFSATKQVLGTFVMYYHEPRSPQRRDLLLIDRATHLVQIAIERVRAQDSLREAQMNLARVSRITTVGELTAAIAHEVNQPLAAVESNASACVRWLSATPPNLDEARRAAGRIANDAKRAGDIITRIRALLRKGAIEKNPVDLNEIIREIVMFTRVEAARHRVVVETRLMETLPAVMGDRVQLQQVILNLAVNAIESMCLGADTPRLLRLETDCPERNLVRITVRDTGIGLTAEQTERLFEAFYTTKPDGLGMGLSISRSIVVSHGGRLWAEPNAGPGVMFRFTLPVERRDQ